MESCHRAGRKDMALEGRLSRGLKIGITVGLMPGIDLLWSNGILQNALNLAETLKGLDCVSSVTLLNTTPLLPPHLPWDTNRLPIVQFVESAADGLDIVLELGGQVSPDQTRNLKEAGTYLVSYACGFEYVHAMQSIIFGRPLWGSQRFINQNYDDLWLIPQIEENSRGYFETLLRCPAKVVPFVWSPENLERTVAALPEKGAYRGRAGRPARVSIMEPNRDVVKFCLNPILICERAYRNAPNELRTVQVCNADGLATGSPEFIALMMTLDIVKDQKATFVGRYSTPNFLSEHTDIVVSHQWSNPLNYFYFDVCWQGFPLVHNAEMCADLGYFYSGNDLEGGARKLLSALNGHDERAEEYALEQKRIIHRYLPDAPEVKQGYEKLILDVLRKPIRWRGQ